MNSSVSGWIGVDLDGTLAYYGGWNAGEIGEPVPEMQSRVKQWLEDGVEVRIMTARVGNSGLVNVEGQCDSGSFVDEQRHLVEAWCEKRLGQKLKVTATKDFGMIELWDDKARRVIPNIGKSIEDHLAGIVRNGGSFGLTEAQKRILLEEIGKGLI